MSPHERMKLDVTAGLMADRGSFFTLPGRAVRLGLDDARHEHDLEELKPHHPVDRAEKSPRISHESPPRIEPSTESPQSWGGRGSFLFYPLEVGQAA